MILNEPLEFALVVATNWLSKVMLTLWDGPKLLPVTLMLVPTDPLLGEIDADGGGVGVGVGIGVAAGIGVSVGVGVGKGVLVGVGVSVGT